MTEKFPSWFLRYRFDHTENGRLRTRRGGEAHRGEPRPRPDVGFSESHASQWPPKTAWPGPSSMKLRIPIFWSWVANREANCARSISRAESGRASCREKGQRRGVHGT